MISTGTPTVANHILPDHSQRNVVTTGYWMPHILTAYCKALFSGLVYTSGGGGAVKIGGWASVLQTCHSPPKKITGDHSVSCTSHVKSYSPFGSQWAEPSPSRWMGPYQTCEPKAWLAIAAQYLQKKSPAIKKKNWGHSKGSRITYWMPGSSCSTTLWKTGHRGLQKSDPGVDEPLGLFMKTSDKGKLIRCSHLFSTLEFPDCLGKKVSFMFLQVWINVMEWLTVVFSLYVQYNGYFS